jgi:hypothetical protein
MGLCFTPGPIANQPGTASATASSWLLFFGEGLQEASVSAARQALLAVILRSISGISKQIRRCPSEDALDRVEAGSTRLPIRLHRVSRR